MAIDWSPIVGATIAWGIAAGSTIFLAVLSKIGKLHVYEETRRRLNLLASISLIFIAVNIVTPFPWFDLKVGVFTVSSLFLTGLVLGGLLGIFVVTKRGTRVREEEDALRVLKFMTWLPPPLQIWILVLGTTVLVEPGGIISTGLFILSGPGAWQFAIIVMSLSSSIRKGASRIIGVMIVSLGFTLGFAGFGLLLRQLTLQGGIFQFQEILFQYLASFSLILVSYFFFYSFWGEKWSAARPIAAIVAILLFAFLTSVRLGFGALQLALSIGIWVVLVAFPFLVYDREYTFRLFECPQCIAEIARPDGHSGFSLFKETYQCREHPEVPLSEYEATYWHSISAGRRLWIFLLGIFYAPWRSNFKVELLPERRTYKVGEPYEIRIRLVRRLDYVCAAAVFVIWKSQSRIIPRSTIKSVDLRNRVNIIRIHGKIPPITWPARDPLTKFEPMKIVVKAGLTGYRPVANEIQFPIPLFLRRKIRLSVERP